jgi:hypothetical protein
LQNNFQFIYHQIMTDTIIMYIAMAVFALSIILSIGIKLEKMTKIIVWNFMLWFLCCSIVICLNLLLSTLWPDEWLYKFITDARYVIVYLLYIWCLILIYHRSTIKSKSHSDPILEKTSYLVFVPINAIWLFLMPLFIYIFPHLIDGYTLSEIASNFTTNLYLQKIVLYFPHILALYTIFTILSFCEFKWGDSSAS